jgi:hypothetical protein
VQKNNFVDNALNAGAPHVVRFSVQLDQLLTLVSSGLLNCSSLLMIAKNTINYTKTRNYSLVQSSTSEPYKNEETTTVFSSAEQLFCQSHSLAELVASIAHLIQKKSRIVTDRSGKNGH